MFESQKEITETTETNINNDVGAGTQETSISFDDYLNTIPEDRREILIKNGVRDTDTLLSSYEGLLSLKGKKGFRPDEDAPQEEKDAYRKEILKDIGVPEDGKYEFSTPEGVEDGYITDEFVNDLAKVAHDKGISQEAFQGVIDTIYPAYQQEIQAYESRIKELQEKLGESGTMNNNANASQKIDQSERADTLMREYIEAYKQGDYDTYNKKKSEYNSLKGY